jgi:hypothetical protein
MTHRLLLVAVLAAFAQDHPAMPPGMTHEEHLAQMKKDEALKKRGAAAMGFDQDATTHHFKLTADGGVIEVLVNTASDDRNRNAVRSHLKETAAAFAAGDFSKPFATHGEEPPGVNTMKANTPALTFLYENVPEGGRVVIRAADAAVIAAVHAFLRYQIREHGTGDPLS